MAPQDTPAAGTGSDRVLQRLMALHPKLIDLSLKRVHTLLARLGHPERALPPVIHVAGTNGKGSLIAFLRAMLSAAGYRVHVATSPHLVWFHERIQLAGQPIGEPDLLALLEEAERANGGEPITFFEITTCAAFLAFARTPADVLLLETGLGGRLDATNVIERPELTAITPIGLDHMDFLGGDLATIAGEKAGIMKPGVPCVAAPQPDEAAAVLRARAEAVGAPLDLGGRDWHAEPASDGTAFTHTGRDGSARRYPAPRLLGPYQLDNAAHAVACTDRLDRYTLPDAAIREGLASATWPGRMQRLTEGALAERLPENWELWLDGGHNPAAGRALAAALDRWRTGEPETPIHVVVGMITSKDPAAFMAPFADRAASVTAVPVPDEPNSFDAATLAERAREAGAGTVTAADSVRAALDRLAASGGERARVLVCGSLYLAGSVLRENG
ncbi:dihydrofolate synthase / folylpolyglutamate synthase [Limimonas halophila]|uniref:Dihydrofolate synthase/folylpolyglutamate synthase n=1 Tax=Limimonas halophila TaxID=1082479 RepID=A0A1G7T7B6_9PROT|nr:folylpolyglutamate synthase/dihydrofolate synthase family protein [Limimonas halophila]SDG30510.1 dihydrofolate synthase / folylpolyglutamate synthase [Limimonas halophila]